VSRSAPGPISPRAWARARAPSALGAAGAQVAVPEGLGRFGVGLRLGQHAAQHRAAGAVEDFDDRAHVGAQVLAQAAGVGERPAGAGRRHEGVHQHRGLAGPPAVQGGLADARLGGHGLHRHGGEAVARQQGVGGAQDRPPGRLAARASGWGLAP
jgi:hypothetical protein